MGTHSNMYNSGGSTMRTTDCKNRSANKSLLSSLSALPPAPATLTKEIDHFVLPSPPSVFLFENNADLSNGIVSESNADGILPIHYSLASIAVFGCVAMLYFLWIYNSNMNLSEEELKQLIKHQPVVQHVELKKPSEDETNPLDAVPSDEERDTTFVPVKGPKVDDDYND